MKKVISFVNKSSIKGILSRNSRQNQGICALNRSWLPVKKPHPARFHRMVFTKINYCDELKQLPKVHIRFIFTNS